jgi:hypothetical protein
MPYVASTPGCDGAAALVAGGPGSSAAGLCHLLRSTWRRRRNLLQGGQTRTGPGQTQQKTLCRSTDGHEASLAGAQCVRLARSFLASPTLQHYGMLRMVRDVFHISGFLLTDACEQVTQIVLNQAAPLASALVHPLRKLLACTHVAVNLDQT